MNKISKFITVEKANPMTGLMIAELHQGDETKVLYNIKPEQANTYNCPIFDAANIKDIECLTLENIEDRGGKRVLIIDNRIVNHSATKWVRWAAVSHELTGNEKNDSIRSYKLPDKYTKVIADLLEAVSTWENKSKELFFQQQKD